ncbi:hypothetical protein LMG33810_002805 [Carnimonas sp. LMG 33810]
MTHRCIECLTTVHVANGWDKENSVAEETAMRLGRRLFSKEAALEGGFEGGIFPSLLA